MGLRGSSDTAEVFTELPRLEAGEATSCRPTVGEIASDNEDGLYLLRLEGDSRLGLVSTTLVVLLGKEWLLVSWNKCQSQVCGGERCNTMLREIPSQQECLHLLCLSQKPAPAELSDSE